MENKVEKKLQVRNLRISFRQNRHLAGNNTTGRFNQFFHSTKTFTGGNYVIHQQNPFAAHQLRIGFVQEQLLLTGRGDGLYRNLDVLLVIRCSSR